MVKEAEADGEGPIEIGREVKVDELTEQPAAALDPVLEPAPIPETVHKIEPEQSEPAATEVKVFGQTVEEASAPIPAPTPAPEPAPAVVEEVVETRAVEPEHTMTEEERRILHENYLRLISQPEPKKVEETPPAPYSESLDTEKLIYNNKPETERDYRNLINNLFVKTVRPAKREEPAPAPVQEVKQERVTVTARYEDASAKAENDGLTVNTTDYDAAVSRRKRFNLGDALFKCSLIVGVIMLLEFMLCLIFKTQLGISLAYPFVIFALALAEVLIFGVLRLTDVGKKAKKPTTLTYLSASIIVTIIVILIICVTSLLLPGTFTSAAGVIANIIVPCIIALNIPVFTTSFYLLNK